MIQWLLFMSLFWASLASSCEDLSCEPPEKLLQVIRDLQQKLKKYHHADGGIYVDPNMGVSHARLPRSVLMQDASAANNTRHPNCPPCPPSACDSNPCLNGGTCLVDVSPKSNNYKCDCPPNFAGEKCEKEIKCDGKKTCGDNAECFVSNRQTNCVCKRGYTKGARRGCLKKVQKSCLSGDPHYTTFDQLKYNYQGTCPYVFSQPCGKLTNGFSNYTVVAKNKLLNPRSTVSKVNEVEVTMHDQRVHLDLTTRKVYFNGNVVSPPYYWPSRKEQKVTVTYAAGRFVVKNDELVEVILTKKRKLCVQVPDTPEFRGKGTLCGLAGNIDGSYDDDIVARNGSIYSVTKLIGVRPKVLIKALDTWITEDFRQLRNDERQCLTADEITDLPNNCDTSKHSLCQPISLASKGEGPFGPCEKMGRSVVLDRLESCRFDMCHKDIKCEVLSDFVEDCMSIVPNTDLGAWREQVKCELTCPLNSHYSSCKSSCPATCAESIAPDSCDQPCSEGCTCDDGYVVDNTVTSKLTCIPIEDCGCTDENGNSFPAKRAVLSYDCQVKSQCMNGSVTSEPNKCSTDGFCGTDASSDMACLCLPGFAGDGYTCTEIDQCQDPRRCSNPSKTAPLPCDMAGPHVVIEPGLGTDFASIAHNVEVDPPTMTFTCTAPAANSFTIISFNRQKTRLVQNYDTVSTTLTCAANGQWQVAGEHITEIGCNVVPLNTTVVIENNAPLPCDMAGPHVVIEPGLGIDFASIAHNVEVDPPTMTFTCTAPAANSFTIISFNRQKTRLVQNYDTVSTTLTCAANGQWRVAGEHITEIGCNVVPLNTTVVIENNGHPATAVTEE